MEKDLVKDYIDCQLVDISAIENGLLLNMKTSTLIYWIARILAVAIMIQTLYFKFSGAAESIYIFTTVGIEPWGRIGIGILELVASILLLFNTIAWLGAGLALGLMLGAIGMHLTILGIEVKDDGGYLFLLCLVVSACSIIILFKNKDKVLNLISVFIKRKQ